MTAVTTHDLNVVHVLVCIDHELIEVHVVSKAMLSDSLSHLQEHFVLLGCAKLLIRTNVEVVSRDTLGRVILLFAFLSAILGVVNEVIIDITDTNDRFTLIDCFLAFRRKQIHDIQSVLIGCGVRECHNQMHMVFAVFTLAVLVLEVLTVRIGVLQSIAYDLFPVLPHVFWVENARPKSCLINFCHKKTSDFLRRVQSRYLDNKPNYGYNYPTVSM